MNQLYCENLSELKREREYLEKKLGVKLLIKGKKIIVEGEPLGEYEMSSVIDAMNLGFSARTACLPTDEDFIFEKINIKDYTRRKNLELVRGRVIGTHGKTKKTIEQISGCSICLHDNVIGIIGPADEIEYALTAIISIIKGTKQTNAYKYLERINTQKRKQVPE